MFDYLNIFVCTQRTLQIIFFSCVSLPVRVSLYIQTSTVHFPIAWGSLLPSYSGAKQRLTVPVLRSRKLTFVLPAHWVLFNFYTGPSAVQLPSPTPVASQQSVCVTLHPPAPAHRGLPTHSNTCSRHAGFGVSVRCLRKCPSLAMLLLHWRFSDVLGNLTAHTGLHSKQIYLML